MAAARTIPLDLIEGFSGAEKVPDRISTKNTFKLKLYDNLLANRKAFEVYDATFRADLGPYAIFLTEKEPTLEEWCQSMANMGHLHNPDGAGAVRVPALPLHGRLHTGQAGGAAHEVR